MKSDESQVILITGASSGIGKTCAEYLAANGYKVYGTSRKAPLKSAHFEWIRMDVTDDSSVKEGINSLLEKEGKIDVVINNAGIGFAGAIEDTSIDEVKMQLETNFLGTFRVCKTVLPKMREQNSGLIINVSSIGGAIGLPFQALYSASKFAVEGMTEGLRMEIKKFGIKATLIEPGDFKTNFTSNRKKTEASQQNSAYKEQFHKTLDIMEKDEMNGPTPEIIAKQVLKIIHEKSPKVRYTVGTFTQKLAAELKRILPSRIFEWIMLVNYKF